MSILDYFPLEKPRQAQLDVLVAIETAFNKGYKNILLEAPVGSGKSAIAVACAKFYGQAHVITPRKSLQDQYLGDFNKESLVTMKGRNAYPCTYESDQNVPEYHRAIITIKTGKVLFLTPSDTPCSEGPCLTSLEAKLKCTLPNDKGIETYPCPYHVAIDTAQNNDIIVHNLHSFIFQTYYSGRFIKRPLLVVDECHSVEGILRGFAEKKLIIPLFIKNEDEPVSGQYKTLEEWVGWLRQFADTFSIKPKSGELSPREEFETILSNMEGLSETIGTSFVVTIERDPISKKSKFIFTPEYVGNLIDTYLLNYGDKRLFMSGTIYSKDLYCRLNGLKQEETCFIKIGSSFPIPSRPIYLKPTYTVDTRHKKWDINFKELVTNIRKVMGVFQDGKGLIHAPSYLAGLTLYNALKDSGRVVIHDKENFQERLASFYADTRPLVFISPTCQEGVDFKGSRAIFQIILRVPYPSTSDKFMEKKVKEDFPYYNYQALITFGQQIGRINRSDDDFGVTVLMDERFNNFIYKNSKTLPKWLLDAIIYK
jgi:ATP-dependent DNA helicase DinG